MSGNITTRIGKVEPVSMENVKITWLWGVDVGIRGIKIKMNDIVCHSDDV